MAPIVVTLEENTIHLQTDTLRRIKEREELIREATIATRRVAEFISERFFYADNALEVIGLTHEAPSSSTPFRYATQQAQISFETKPLTHLIAVPRFARTGSYTRQEGPFIRELKRKESNEQYCSRSIVSAFVPIDVLKRDIRFYPVKVFIDRSGDASCNCSYAVVNIEDSKVAYWASPHKTPNLFDCTEIQSSPNHALWLAFPGEEDARNNSSNIPGAFLNPNPDFMRDVLDGLHNAYPRAFAQREEIVF